MMQTSSTDTTKHLINFFTTEDGDPWAVFIWGEAPASAFTIEACVEAVCWHGGWDRAEALELIGLGIDPVPLWLLEDREAAEDNGYRYTLCRADHPNALRITGAQF